MLHSTKQIKGYGKEIAVCTSHEHAGTEIKLKSPDERFGEDDGTGYELWDAAKVLLAFATDPLHNNLKGKKVLELGAGLGLVGIGIAAAVGPEGFVLMTDQRGIVDDVLEENVALNNARLGTRAETAVLNWGRSDWKEGPLRGVNPGEWDYIVCSDCIVLQEMQICLNYTLRQLMPPGCRTKLLVSYTRRSTTCDRFAPRLREHDFEVKEIAASDVRAMGLNLAYGRDDFSTAAALATSRKGVTTQVNLLIVTRRGLDD